MRSCIVAIAKYENDYIREWIEYNLNLGFDHIFIGDNNDDHKEDIFTIVEDYVKDNKVTVVNIKDFNIKQIDFYKMSYLNLVGNFDWVLYYDIDEFLVLKKHKNVNDYLSQEKFNNFDVIKINQKMMTNNGYVIQIDKPVLERFTQEAENFKCKHTFYDADGIEHPCHINNTIKSFYRTGKNLIPATHSTEKEYSGIRYCNAIGEEIFDKPYWPNWSQYNEFVNHDEAYLMHFATKSLEEYVKYKMKRGWSCFKTPELQEYVFKNCLNLDVFEEINGKSPLYQQMYKELLIKYGLNEEKGFS